jgi:hypothetical protein
VDRSQCGHKSVILMVFILSFYQRIVNRYVGLRQQMGFSVRNCVTIFSLSFGYFYGLFNDTAITSDFI